MTAFLVEGIYYANFFVRVVNALSESEKKEIVFYSLNEETSCFIQARLPQCRSVVLPVLPEVPGPQAFMASKPLLAQKLDQAVKGCFEHVIGGGSYEVCWRVVVSYFLALNQWLTDAAPDKLIMCSGCAIGAKTATILCEIKKIPMQFVELANLPDKIFVDPEGTNANARLASHPELLDAYPEVDDVVHQAWMETYRASKALPPPQARGNPLSEAISALSSDTVLENTQPYLFVPLQVSNDAQLWLHSDCKNADAIRHAVAMAAQSGALVAIKIHPAETSRAELSAIEMLQKQLGFRITQEPTTALLQHAQAVVTINSTVGLEAMLYHKPLTVLGRSYYKAFDDARLRKYIHHYLFSGVAFFGQSRIERKTALAFLQRC